MNLKLLLNILLYISFSLALTCNELKKQLNNIFKEENECKEKNGQVVELYV